MIEGKVSAATGRTTAADEPRHRRPGVASPGKSLASRADELVALVKAVEAKPKPRARITVVSRSTTAARPGMRCARRSESRRENSSPAASWSPRRAPATVTAGRE